MPKEELAMKDDAAHVIPTAELLAQRIATSDGWMNLNDDEP